MYVTVEQAGLQDEVSTLLAEFAVEADGAVSMQDLRSVAHTTMDTLAVVLGALDHRAAVAGRRYAAMCPADPGAQLIGTDRRVSLEAAVLANNVPLRVYDYNDYYMGERNGGHPSEIALALLSVADHLGASGRDYVLGVAIGYDVALSLFDTMPVGDTGWDYANLTAIAATCAISRLMGLDVDQTRHALAITVTPHLATNELESGDLNSRGDLTMWKRFNSGDAMRQSVYACRLASVGVEGVVRPFTGRMGMFAQMGFDSPLDDLQRRLDVRRTASRAGDSVFKRWPVGSRGQSAIQAALSARSQLASPDPESIRQVSVHADPAVIQHLLTARKDPFNPVSRETADHSLPYIVAVALLDGRVTPASFDVARVRDERLGAFLRRKIAVHEDQALAGGPKGGFPVRVVVETTDGTTVVGEAAPPPGHPLNPFTDRGLEEKLHECADPVLGAEAVSDLARRLWAIGDCANVRDILQLLVVDGLDQSPQEPTGASLS